MKIVHLVAGAAGMYCGSCLQGNTLATALRQAGEDLTLMPLYTPLKTDEPSVSESRVGMGGINVYLQQRWKLFRHTPRWLDRLFDRPTLLRSVAKIGSSTRPEQLGELTISMLRGEEGRQRKELDKLAEWLADELRPELIHLNNGLLVGLARQLTARLGVPVVSSLAGEDSFIEKLPDPFRKEAWSLMRERCAELPGLATMNGYYARAMAAKLDLPQERFTVIPPGLAVEGQTGRNEQREDRRQGTPFTVGFLARICADKGLHRLAEAFEILVERLPTTDVQLRVAGYLHPAERPYLAEIEAGLKSKGLSDRFEYVGEPDLAGKHAFLRSLDVMCLPTDFPESKGLPVFEAWANATPVVVPSFGVFPELIEDTGGGILHEPHDLTTLAEALVRMANQPDLAAECGRRGQQAVIERYNAKITAERTIAWYRTVVKRTSGPRQRTHHGDTEGTERGFC